MIDALQGQFGLLPKCLDQLRSSLHGSQAPTCEVADFSKVRWTQVGDLMLLQIGPDRLDRIELGRVRRQERDGDASCFLYRSHESNEPLISRTFFALHGRFLYMRFVGK